MLRRTGIVLFAARLAVVALAALWASPHPAAAAEKTTTAVGIVADYSASGRSFSIRDDEGKSWKFVWNQETKFNGVVSNGARVTVRYTPQPDGANLAQTVGVLK